MTPHQCVQCLSDGAPSCADPARPYCQPSGALAGACTECTGTHPQLCGGAKPRCLTDLGLCGCSNVNGDGDCGGLTSGLICNGPAGICVPGCSAASGRNGCPVGQTCSNVSGGVGTCSPVGGCTINGDCVVPTTACDTSVTPHQCVQCLSDGACAMPLVCAPTGHICVECTPTNSTACVTTGSGGKCLAAGTCGCDADSDCGGLTSGRICDGALHKCTIGCRGTGGNGCPTGLACTSGGASAGQCRPPSDGGVDGGNNDGGADRPGDGRVDGATDGTDGGNGADGRDGAGSDGRAGRDGSGADGSGENGDGNPDGPIGDAGIGIRVLNLAGGGCQCALQPSSARDAAPIGLCILLAALVVRRRRRR